MLTLFEQNPFDVQICIYPHGNSAGEAQSIFALLLHLWHVFAVCHSQEARTLYVDNVPEARTQVDNVPALL